MTVCTEVGSPLDRDELSADEFVHSDVPSFYPATPLKCDSFCTTSSSRWIQIAPMLDVTDSHFRMFSRLLTRRAQLWTEMVVADTVIHHPNTSDILSSHAAESPLVCQLGGADPEAVAVAAQRVEDFGGYQEINLNVGCPSSRVVQRGCFGAVLMKSPERVRDIVHSIARRVSLPVSIKTRIGVDNLEGGSFLHNFISETSKAGVSHFIIHARKAWLKGVNPAKNRSMPPLRYDCVYQLCKDFPHLQFTLNGAVDSLDLAESLLNGDWTPKDSTVEFDRLMRDITSDYSRRPLTGIMIGRASISNPLMLSQVDTRFYGEEKNPSSCSTRRSLVDNYSDYLDSYCEKYSGNESHMSDPFRLLKPIFGLLYGRRGNRSYRQSLDISIRQWKNSFPPKPLVSSIIDSVIGEIADFHLAI